MAVEIHSYPDSAGLAHDAAARWVGLLDARSKSPAANEPYCAALSGGRIAKGFFSEIAGQAAARLELFKGMHFFWADERCVPPTDPESNYGIARQLLFEPLKVPAGQIHRLRGEENEALALRDAVENIREWGRPRSGEGQPIFDMIFLGMGEDGHVASLFPGEPDAVMADPAIYRAVTAVKPPPRRMTLGYGMINGAKEVWALVSGADKSAALKESLSATGKTPFARVLNQRKRTEIFTDVA
jgi:6-phosphogluconolactonase